MMAQLISSGRPTLPARLRQSSRGWANRMNINGVAISTPMLSPTHQVHQLNGSCAALIN